jgi:hypothetical protein
VVRPCVGVLDGLPSPRAAAFVVACAPSANCSAAHTSSWGGSVVWGDDGLYHMFVSENIKSCGLHQWSHNMIMQVQHAASASPLAAGDSRCCCRR